jgi:hypothetical protein
MGKPAFFTDEDVYAAVAVALRKAGLDAVSTLEAGRLGESCLNRSIDECTPLAMGAVRMGICASGIPRGCQKGA